MFSISCLLSSTLSKILFLYQIYAKSFFKKVSMYCYKDMQMLMYNSFWKKCYSCDTSGKICSSHGKKCEFTFVCLLVKFYVVTSIFVSSYFFFFLLVISLQVKEGEFIERWVWKKKLQINLLFLVTGKGPQIQHIW